MTQNTADTTHINLVCEDRQTGKKCQFNDLAIIPLPDGQIRLGDLISSHISLHYFLSNSMIFKHTPEIDIVIGFYPSAELNTLALPVSTSAAGISTLSFKFEKIPTYSSDSEPSQVLNQNQIRSNKIINFPNQSLGKQPNFNLLPVKSQEAPPPSSKISLPQTESKSTASSTSQEDECLGSTDERESDGRKDENLKVEENNSKIKCEEQQICSEGNNKMHGSDESKEQDSLEAQEEQLEAEIHQGNPSEEEKGSSSSSSLNRKRKTSEALDCSKSCSPCTSFTENDQQDMIQQPPLLKKKQISAATSNIDLSIAQNSNPTNNFSYLPTKPLSSFGVNSSFNVYNPISTTSGIKLGDFSQQQTGMTYSQASQFQQITQSTSNILLNNNCNGSSRQSRNKERTIKEAIEMVTKWRDLQEDYRQKHQVKGLQEVADELNISKKVLDYYFQELRTAEFFGFDFDSNLSSKMGVLRKFIDEQKKNHENKNKNFKITRNLQFRYRLKEDGSNFMNMGSTVSSSSGIENQNINIHQSKNNQKNNCNEELNSNLFQTNMVISRLLRPSNTINNSADSSSNQEDSPNKKINGIENFNNILSNQNQTVSPCSSFQEVLSKNSPLFLSFFNTHNTTIQSTFTPSIVKPTFNGVQQQQFQKQLSQQQEQPKQLKSQKKQAHPSQLLTNPQTSVSSSSTKSSSFISQNPKNTLPTLPRKSSSSQQLQQTTQQLAGLDKALLLLELINQTTQQSQTPFLNTNPTSTNVTESSKFNSNNNFSNPSNNLFEDVFNLMKLLSPSTEAPGMSTDSQDKKIIPASKVASSPFLLAAKNSNSPSDSGSFLESNEHRLEDVLQVKQIQNE